MKLFPFLIFYWSKFVEIRKTIYEKRLIFNMFYFFHFNISFFDKSQNITLFKVKNFHFFEIHFFNLLCMFFLIILNNINFIL